MGSPPLEDETARVNGFVAVVGTVNFDRILSESGAKYESLGGILYNGLVLGHLLEGTGVGVRLVARLGAEHIDAARRLFEGFAHVDSGGLLADPRGTNLSLLDCTRGPDRHEVVEFRVPPLDARDLRGIESARVVLVNMISGRDVEREALADARSRSSATFLLDVQALARTFESPRRPRTVPDAREWAAHFHVVRGNEAEITAFAGTPNGLSAAAAAILDAGPREVFVTRGAAGSIRFTRRNGELREEPIAPVARVGDADSTGCGDAYDAALVVGACFGWDGLRAGRLGSFVGSEVAGVQGLVGVRGLRGMRERAERFDPGFTLDRAAPSGP